MVLVIFMYIVMLMLGGESYVRAFGLVPLLASSALWVIPCLIGLITFLHAVVDASRCIDFPAFPAKLSLLHFLCSGLGKS